jgi:hypothetical protein
VVRVGVEVRASRNREWSKREEQKGSSERRRRDIFRRFPSRVSSVCKTFLFSFRLLSRRFQHRAALSSSVVAVVRALLKRLQQEER